MPPEAPPEGAEIALKIRRLLVTCPYITLETAAAMYGMEDIELLIYQLMTIEDFTREQ